MDYLKKANKYKYKYYKLKQTGGATIYELINNINHAVRTNTITTDFEPIDMETILHFANIIRNQKPVDIANNVNILNDSSRNIVFKHDTFTFIQIKIPTIHILKDTTTVHNELATNFYLCTFNDVVRENFTIFNIFWLVELKKTKAKIYKVLLPQPSSL
jgi:hypothetical protein